MKTALSLLSVIAMICALAMPAAAQRVTQGEVNRFNGFLSNHPRVAQDLTSNPGLVNNRGYLNGHPELHSFLANHDELRRSLQGHPGKFMYREGRYSWYGPWAAPPAYAVAPPAWEQMHNYGYWDESHVWHDRDWWEHNRREWIETHHPIWAFAPPDYWELRHNYGYWDENHVWHDRDWWEHNRREWIETHHPRWLAAEERYRQRYEAHEERVEHERAEERAEHQRAERAQHHAERAEERAEHREHHERERAEHHDHDRDHH